jgi:integrase
MRTSSMPGVYQRGSRWVAVYRIDGVQHKESAATFREAREIKVRRTAQEAARRAGPTLHSHALEWIDHYAGRGANDVINDRTRREYRRLLITYALSYFDPEVRLRDIDDQHTHAFVEWICRHPGPDGRRLSDRSIHNAVQPLRACLRHAVASGRLDRAPGTLVMPRRRRGVPYVFDERRFLTRDQLADLLCEIPDAWRPLFELLVSTGLRISEAIALRVIDARVELEPPRVYVRRAIVGGEVTTPKSRHGRRTIPIGAELASKLAVLVDGRGPEQLLFVGARGSALRSGNLRYRVLIPAAPRAGVPWARFHTLRHTCAALLIASGMDPLALPASPRTTSTPLRPARASSSSRSSTAHSSRRPSSISLRLKKPNRPKPWGHATARPAARRNDAQLPFGHTLRCSGDQARAALQPALARSALRSRLGYQAGPCRDRRRHERRPR